MRKLILVVKVFSAFYLLLMLSSCKVQKQEIKKSQIIYNIILGDHFKNDIISLSINGTTVLKNICLLSDFAAGVTDTEVEIVQYEKKIYFRTLENKELKKINIKPDNIKLEFIYKGNVKEFVVEKDKGRYILISDNGKGSLSLMQSIKMFQLD
jgi:hypothetical protein